MAFTKIAAAGIGSTETVTVDGLTVINNGSFGGNLSVGGTLTYEDVTNVDSVGLITARSGINVGSGITLSKDGDIFATGVTTTGSLVSSGAISGTTGTFTGNVSIADKIVHTGDTHTAIRFHANDTVSVDTGGNQQLTIGSNVNIITGELVIPDTIRHREDSNTKIRFPAADTITFETAGSERLRITDDGRIGINDSSPNDYELDIQKRSTATDVNMRLYNNGTASSNDTIMRFHVAGTSAKNIIYFGDGDDSNIGMMRYDHSNDSMQVHVNTVERIRIKSDGHVGIGSHNPESILDIREEQDGAETKIRLFNTDNDNTTTQTAALYLSPDSRATALTGLRSIKENADMSTSAARDVSLSLNTLQNNSQVEALRINSSGKILIGDDTAENTMGLNANVQTFGTDASSSGVAIRRGSNDAQAAFLILSKSRNTSVGSRTILNNGDEVGNIFFVADDGTDLISNTAAIKSQIDAAPGANDTPGNLSFWTTADGSNSATQRMKITSAGKIGIGLDNPNTLLHIQDAAISGYGSQSSSLLVLEDTGNTSLEIASGFNNTGSIFFGDTGSSNKGQINYLHGSGGDAMTFITNDGERLRIRSGGDVTTTGDTGFTRTTAGITARAGDSFNIARASGTPLEVCRTTNTGNMINFFYGTTNVASISYNGSNMTYGGTSDYRLKENVVEMTGGIDAVKKLNPIKFNFIDTPEKTVEGFIAHEVQEVIPQAVTGEKDCEVDEEGKGYQQLDPAQLVPTLTTALQEAITRIETLELEVSALKGS